MQKISEKSKGALYEAVNEAIMQARIKAALLLKDNQQGREVDDIFYDLIINAPQRAIEVFKK